MRGEIPISRIRLGKKKKSNTDLIAGVLEERRLTTSEKGGLPVLLGGGGGGGGCVWFRGGGGGCWGGWGGGGGCGPWVGGCGVTGTLRCLGCFFWVCEKKRGGTVSKGWGDSRGGDGRCTLVLASSLENRLS